MTQKVQQEPVAGWATDCRDKYPENHDSGYAGRICMSDGNLAWAAVIADGAGGSMEGLKVSALAIQAFVEAVRMSSLAELSDSAARDAWMRRWTKALHEEAFSRFKGGMATFCGAVLLPGGASRPGEPPWRLFTLNVGDSQVLRLTGDGKCMGIVPDAPPNNANVEGHNPIRVVGVAPKGDFALLDIEEFPVPANGPMWVLAGSDGFFSKKKGKDEICIFSSGDMRDLCLDAAVPFQELPARAIARSLDNARKLDCAELMDNSTVAMLGFRVPATALKGEASAPKSSGQGPRPTAPSPKAQGPRPTSPVGEGKGGDRRTNFLRLSAIAALGLVLGLLLGRVTGGASPSAAKAKEAEKRPVNYRGVPGEDEGRCARCLELVRQGKLKPEKAFHWAESEECPFASGAPTADSRHP